MILSVVMVGGVNVADVSPKTQNAPLAPVLKGPTAMEIPRVVKRSHRAAWGRPARQDLAAA